MKPLVDYANGVAIECVDFCFEKRLKVLLADDDASFLAVAKQCLEEAGYFQVDTASSAEEALEKLERLEFDAVVTDYQMPGKNGLELLREVRRAGNDVPFILFTSKGREEVAIEALNSGVERYIAKQGDAETVYNELKRSICSAVKKHKSEKLLRESENRLRLITENMQDVLLLTDGSLACTHVSSSIKWILGYEPSEVVGRPIYEFIHPDDLNTVMAAIGKAVDTKLWGRMEVRCRRANGSYALVEGHGKILVDSEGNFTSAVVTIRDITERKKTEEALKASEEKYRSLFENMLNGFAYCEMIWDEKGQPVDFVYLEVNDAFEKLTGLRKEAVLGKKATEAIPGIKEAHPELFDIYSRVTSTGKEESLEIHFKPLDIWLFISVYSPKKNYFAAVFENITKRKRDLEKMRFQANLLNVVGQAVIATDKDAKVTYWNHAAEQLHGWSESEMIDESISKIIPEDIAQEFKTRVDSHLKIGESWNGEVNIKRKDGAVFPIMVTISPIKDEQGGFVGTVSVETDISEQKWMQEVTNEAVAKVSELNEKLHVVESLTRHDIRNKLSALNGRVFLLKKRLADNPNASTHLRELELSSQQILMILEFERIYVLVGAEELTNVNVANSFAQAASLFSNLKAAELVNDCNGLVVLADSLLRQLFYNLMDNSFKYGEKLSRIRVHYEELENQLNLIYEDDGVGIPESVKSSLFKEGFGKGTGYGLYLIKRICEAYGWTIQETGKQGEGVKFTMTIPKHTKDGKESYQTS